MHALLRNEARSAGLRRREVSLHDVDRRRTELWALAVSVVTATAVLASIAPDQLPWFSEDPPTWALRAALGLLSAVFVAYVFEKEVHLRRLQALLLDERIRSHTEAARVAELTKLDEMKSQFLSTVSHELKTPLTSIIGSVSVLRRASLTDSEREEFLESIDRQSRRLAGMVDQLLVAGQVEEGASGAGPVADLSAVARVVVADFTLGGRPVELDVPESCPVRCGAEALQHILVNLLDNALKHGAPPVRLEAVTRGNAVGSNTAGSMVVCSVLDEGTGVPVEDRELVFERFHRLDTTGSRPGMGLGLPIVRQIAEACGGRVWIDARPGGGTAVRIALEACDAQHEAQGVTAASGTLVEKPAAASSS